MHFSSDVTDILKNAPLGYIGTVDDSGTPNISPKGIIDFDATKGYLFFLDLYCRNTRRNLMQNKQISVAIVDVEKFRGYQFKGTAELIDSGPEFDRYVLDWELEKHNRFRQRINFNIKKYLEPDISEYNLPKPKYLVKVHVSHVYDLAPKPGKPVEECDCCSS